MKKNLTFAECLALVKTQKGIAAVGGIVSGLIGVVIIGLLAVNLWGTFVGTGTSVAALTETDAGTVTLKAVWPIVLTIGGIGVAVAALYYVLNKFGIMG